LEEAGLTVEQKKPINVFYKGTPVGEYFADLFVDGRVIIEIKSVQNLAKEHEVQLVNYLTATGIDIGLLINFGKSVEVKRKFRMYKPAKVRRLDGETPRPRSIQQNPVSPVNPVN